MTLLRTCLESAALAAVVAMVCFLVPRMRPGHKAMLWWLVAAKLLIGLVPLPSVEVAALPASASTPAVAEVTAAAVPIGALRDAATVPATTIDLGWGVTLWILCTAILIGCAVPGWLRARDWRRSGETIDDEDLARSVSRAARLVGLRREPRVLAVEGLPGPLVTGFVAPCVLLPAESLRRLSSEELEMTLAHEMAHIARGDLWWGLVPALARRIFFFHPAAWIAEREYALAREAACDEAVLRPGRDAFAYGRLLLRFASRTPASASIAMSPHTMLRRRLEMIESVARRVPLSRVGWAIIAVAALALIPVRLVAKESRVEVAPSESASSACLQIAKDVDTAYVITNGRSHTMCGDASDVRDAERARGNGGDVIWFRVGNESWVIRDPEAVAQGQRYFSAITRIGQMQSEIGIAQSHLGVEQSQIGMEQSRIGIEQSKFAMEQAERAQLELALALQQHAAEEKAQQGKAVRVDEQRRRELVEEELRAAQAKQPAVPDDDTKRLQEQMEVLAQRMHQLGERQGDFGEQQRRLGERMNRELAETQRALSEFLERSIKDGRAQPAN